MEIGKSSSGNPNLSLIFEGSGASILLLFVDCENAWMNNECLHNRRMIQSIAVVLRRELNIIDVTEQSTVVEDDSDYRTYSMTLIVVTIESELC